MQAVLTSEQGSLQGLSSGHSMLRRFPENNPPAHSWTLLPPSGERAPQPPASKKPAPYVVSSEIPKLLCIWTWYCPFSRARASPAVIFQP